LACFCSGWTIALWNFTLNKRRNPRIEIQLFKKIKSASKDATLANEYSGNVCVPLKIHDALDGSGGEGMDKLNKNLATLNLQFKPANTEFYFS